MNYLYCWGLKFLDNEIRNGTPRKINIFLLGLGLRKGEVIPHLVCNKKWQVLHGRHTEHCFPGLPSEDWHLVWFLLYCCMHAYFKMHPILLPQRSWWTRKWHSDKWL